MSYTYATSTTAGNASGNALSVTKPASTVDGDLLIMVFYWEGLNQTITAPSGWQVLRTYDRNTGTSPNFCIISYFKWASGEPASWSWTPSVNTNWRTAVGARYTPPSNGTGAVDDVDSGATGTTSTTFSAPTITTNHASETVLALGGTFQGATVGYTSGVPSTIRVQLGGLFLADGVKTTAGATGAATYNAGSSDYSIQQVALLDNTGGGATPAIIVPSRSLRGAGI